MLSADFIRSLFQKGKEREVLFFSYLYAHLHNGYSISCYEIQSRFGIPKSTAHRIMEQKWNSSGIQMKWKWNKNELIFNSLDISSGTELEQQLNRNEIEKHETDQGKIVESPKTNVKARNGAKTKNTVIENQDSTVQKIVEYLNNVTGKKFAVSNSTTRSLILNRLSEGFSVEDFCRVIDMKSQEWINTEYDKYLRPQTLFGGKFESYLNSRMIEANQTSLQFHANISRNDQYQVAADRAREIDYGTLADQ